MNIPLMTYNSGTTVTSALNSGTISLSVNSDVNLSGYDWCAGCPVCNEYIIITDTFTMNKTSEENAYPLCYCTKVLTDSKLIEYINLLAASQGNGIHYSSLYDAMEYARSVGFFITNQNYPSIVTSGCVLNLDAGLPASYPMTGDFWYDLTGTGNITSLVNGVQYNSSLKGSLVFDGVNQYGSVTSPTNNIPISDEPYTISIWFNTDTIGNYGLIGWGAIGSPNQENSFSLTPTGLVNSWVSNDLNVSVSISTGTWYNAVSLYDGTTREIWLDGSLIGSDTPTGLNIPYAVNLTIGLTDSTQFFDGKIGELQIFDRGLSSDEIISNYNALLPRYLGSNTEICIDPIYCTEPEGNVFALTTNNLWSNPLNWSSGYIPTSTDTAIITSNCIVDINNAICDELYVRSASVLSFNNSTTLQISGITNYGSITVTGSSSFLTMSGNDTKNTIWGNTTFGNTGTMNLWNNTGTLTVPDLDYFNMNSGANTYLGNRLLNTPITIRGSLYTGKGVLFVTADLTVDGICQYGGEAYGLQISNCTVIFNSNTSNPNSDSVRFTNTTIYANGVFQLRGFGGGLFFYGDNTVYLKNGLDITGNAVAGGTIIATGTTFTCTTNSQTISTPGISMKSLTIQGNITVTNIPSVQGPSGFITTPILTGTTTTSTLINKGVINYNGSTIPIPSGSGILDCSSFSNTFNYRYVGNQTLALITYWNLGLYNQGISGFTKTVPLNLITLGNLYTEGSFILDINYDIIVNGTYTQGIWAPTNGGCTIRKYTNGNMIFKGYYRVISGYSTSIDVAPNAPGIIVEFQGGGLMDGYPNYKQCTMKMTTNNQIWSFQNEATPEFDNLSILDGISITGTSTVSGGLSVVNGITGTTGSSISLTDKGQLYMYGATPFVNCSLTGTINTKVSYLRSGNQTVNGGVYGDLTLGGSGTKTLQGNVSVLDVYTLVSGVIKDDAGYTFSNP